MLELKQSLFPHFLSSSCFTVQGEVESLWLYSVSVISVFIPLHLWGLPLMKPMSFLQRNILLASVGQSGCFDWISLRHTNFLPGIYIKLESNMYCFGSICIDAQ